MSNSIIIAIAIVVAAVILKLPLLDFAPPEGRYQISGTTIVTYRIDTTTGDTWWTQHADGRWKSFADNVVRP